MDFAAIIASNGKALMEAPLLFAAAILAGYALARLHYARQIETLREQMNLWKDRFDGASADQVKARLDALEAALRGRRLTQEQSDLIATIAKHPGGDFVAIYVHEVLGSPDAARYAKDLRVAFKKAGWRVSGSSLVTSASPSKSGLRVEVQRREKQLPGEEVVLAALRAAKVPCDVSWTDENIGAIYMIVGPTGDD